MKKKIGIIDLTQRRMYTDIKCKVCIPKPGGVIPVDDVKNPHCSNCGRKLISTYKPVTPTKDKCHHALVFGTCPQDCVVTPPQTWQEEWKQLELGRLDFCGNEDHECECSVKEDQIKAFISTLLVKEREDTLNEFYLAIDEHYKDFNVTADVGRILQELKST